MSINVPKKYHNLFDLGNVFCGVILQIESHK